MKRKNVTKERNVASRKFYNTEKEILKFTNQDKKNLNEEKAWRRKERNGENHEKKRSGKK